MAYDLPSFVPAPAPVAVAKPISAPAPAPVAVAIPISAPIYTSSNSAISSPAAPNAVPTVNATGLNSSTFNNLVNSQTASSFFSQLATQNLASVVSQISQTQIGSPM